MQGLLDDAGSEAGAVGLGGSSWGHPTSNRALRRRGSSGSSEFYFVEKPQQQGVAGGAYVQQAPQVRSRDSGGGQADVVTWPF